jgi:hypothetical protein
MTDFMSFPNRKSDVFVINKQQLEESEDNRSYCKGFDLGTKIILNLMGQGKI